MLIDRDKGKGKIVRVKCLSCGQETHISKEGNPNFNKQVEALTSKPCAGGVRQGRDIIGREVEKCGGRVMLDMRIRPWMR